MVIASNLLLAALHGKDWRRRINAEGRAGAILLARALHKVIKL